MSIRTAASLLLAVALAVFGVLPAAGHATAGQGNDLRILGHASKMLGHVSRTRVIAWLDSRTAVERVGVGKDGRTLDLHFHDGFHALILADRLSTVALPTAGARSAGPLASRARLSGARAAVWTPFATELGLGSHAGDIEASDLQKAGFQVSELSDEAVTVEAMSSLSSYNVVYMHTHTGTSGNGDGVLATGELASSGDPTAESYMSDGSVVVVGVMGSTSAYYAITGRFVTEHMGQFPQSSLLVFNGCALLPATAFWQALANKGAGVMVSWSADSTTYDDYLSGAALFNQLAQGQSVAAAISTLQANGYGTSQWNGTTSTLGYRGDGTITLARAGQGQISQPTSTPAPTRTPRPTSTVTTTATPTGTSVPPRATATATPTHVPSAEIVSLDKRVKPGQRQHIVVQSQPGTNLVLDVQFPNGTHFGASQTPDTSGKATFTYTQPVNVITRHSRKAEVQVEAGTVQMTDAAYTIGFAPIDLLLGAHQIVAGHSLAISVHTAARTSVVIQAGKKHVLRTKTGRKGWATLKYRVPKAARGKTLAFTAQAQVHGKVVRTRSTVTIS